MWGKEIWATNRDWAFASGRRRRGWALSAVTIPHGSFSDDAAMQRGQSCFFFFMGVVEQYLQYMVEQGISSAAGWLGFRFQFLNLPPNTKGGKVLHGAFCGGYYLCQSQTRKEKKSRTIFLIRNLIELIDQQQYQSGSSFRNQQGSFVRVNH